MRRKASIYDYIDQSKLRVRNIDLPIKKLNTKKRIRKHHRVLGNSMARASARSPRQTGIRSLKILTVRIMILLTM